MRQSNFRKLISAARQLTIVPGSCLGLSPVRFSTMRVNILHESSSDRLSKTGNACGLLYRQMAAVLPKNGSRKHGGICARLVSNHWSMPRKVLAHLSKHFSKSLLRERDPRKLKCVLASLHPSFLQVCPYLGLWAGWCYIACIIGSP